jgi:hypothetical protein
MKAWRQHDSHIDGLLDAATQLLRQRNNAAGGYPTLDLSDHLQGLGQFYSAYERLQESKSLLKGAERRRLLKTARAVVPVVKAGMWTRWIELENSLNQW